MRNHVLTLDELSVSQQGRVEPQAFGNSNPNSDQVLGAKYRRKETLEYRLLFGVTFVVFLLAAIIEAINPFRSRERGERKESIVQKARFGAKTCVKYAFMG